MLKRRMIVSLLWRKMGLVQSRGFTHTNVVGDPKVAIEFFNAWDADEIVLLNVERNDEAMDQFLHLVEFVSLHCFLPLSVGGWVTSVDRARNFVAHGADKVVINTAGFQRPEFFGEVAELLGTQAVIAAIDVRGNQEKGYEVFVDRGRAKLDLTPEAAAKLAVENGAGEILLTSIDRDGSLQGYDEELVRRVAAAVDVPLIAFGGVGNWEHLEIGLASGAEAVAAGNIFHFTEQSTRKAKNYLRGTSFSIR
jgi:cyclase